MTLRQYQVIMGVGAALAWAATATVVLTVSPEAASPTLVVFLYAAIFLALLGTLAVLGLAARAFLKKRGTEPTAQVAASFRQAALLAALATASLFLSSRGWLNWWSALVMVAVFTGAELLLISVKVKEG